MSRLGIEGADYGFDEAGSEKALEEINEKVILEVINRMEGTVESLMDTVDDAWVGPSAEIFKDNFIEDLSTIEYGIQKARQKLYNAFSAAQQQMFDADTGILNRREGDYNGR